MEKKVILITGASSGMGKISAVELIKEGHIVYGAARDTKQMSDLVQAGGYALAMDVTNENDLKQGVDKIVKEQGRIDVLWNNAGYGLYGPVEEVSLDDARYQFEVNLFGLARLTQLVLPHMRKRKSGLIINTSSMGGKIYTPLGSWYHATKHAVEGFSDCLRLEVKQFGIDVVILEPGAIQTSFAQVLLEKMAHKHDNGPYGKIAKSLIKGTRNIKGSSPKVIAKTIQKIISTKKPKTRYLVGKFAKLFVFIRKWFGDRAFDNIVMSQIK